MASIETGHAKNVAIFEDLISYCTSLGGTYNPSKGILHLAAMNPQLAAAQTALQTVKTNKTAYDNATNGREIAMGPLKSLTTKIINALKASDATSQTIDDARSIANKIRGTGKSKSAAKQGAEASAAAAKTNSTSQQSYDKLVDHFAQLIEILAQQPSYQPNENQLKVVNLNALRADLAARNTAVGNGWINLSGARLNRNNILYAELTGMVDVGMAVKSYLKSVFGATSPQFKQVSKLKFTRPPGD